MPLENISYFGVLIRNQNFQVIFLPRLFKWFFANDLHVIFLPRVFKCIEGLVREGEKGCNSSPASSTLDNFLQHAPTKLFWRKDFSVIIFDGFSLVLGGCFFFIYFSPASSLTCFQESNNSFQHASQIICNGGSSAMGEVWVEYLSIEWWWIGGLSVYICL